MCSYRTLMALIAALLSVNCLATTSLIDDLRRFDRDPERGWYFYASQPQRDLHPAVPLTPHATPSSPTKIEAKKPCQRAKTWTLACGFIDPTQMTTSPAAAYQFEQQEYHALMRQYALYPNNLQAVYHFQQFNFWALNQAMTAAYAWQYNVAQHPAIDANIQVPVSQFGIHVIKHIQAKRATAFWQFLAKSAFFVLITRSNNPACQAEGRVVQALVAATHVPVWDLSLDQAALPGFAHVMHYSTLPTQEQQAIRTHLKLQWLPTLYLYLKPVKATQMGQWIRISSGLTPLDQIQDRTLNFVQAYRHAIVTGVGKNRKQQPNFSNHHLYGLVNTQGTFSTSHPQEERHA